MSSTKQQAEVCSECDANAKWYCIQDEANFCDEHKAVAHSLKSQKLHKIVSIEEKAVIIRNENVKPMNFDIHKQHSDQVKSVVDVANDERKILAGHLEKIRKLNDKFSQEQNQLKKKLQNLNNSEAKSCQDIDKEFDQIIACIQTRRKTLKKQLEEKSKICRDNICSRQEDVKNISLSLNRCLEDGEQSLTLNDFAALSESKNIIERITKLEAETTEYYLQTQLVDSIPFHISNQTFLQVIDTLGTIGAPPTPSFVQQKCQINAVEGNIEWESIECSPPITAYILELGQNNNFKEVYRGIETKFYLKDLTQNTSYVVRLRACNECGISNSTLLEIKTLELSNNWTLSMSSTYATLNAENRRESLLDGLLTAGAATNNGASWIQATFPYPVPVTNVTIAPLHTNPNTWTPTNGHGGSLQYSNNNTDWTTIGTINYVENQLQTINVGNITAQYWRLSYDGHLGTSSFIFK